MESANVTFTTNEAKVLIQLIDIAVKAQGLAAAEAGLVLTRKVQDAFSESGAEVPTLDQGQPVESQQQEPAQNVVQVDPVGNVGTSGNVGNTGSAGSGGSI
jgi:hypothetical protein